MNSSQSALMITTFFSLSQGKNHYTVSSPNTYRKNLDKFHHVKIKRRCYFYHMRALEDQGYIRREQRYNNDDAGLIRQIPSMTTFCLKGIAWMVRMGVVGAKAIYKKMVTHLNKGDKRFPRKKDFDDGSWKPADPEYRKWLENKLAIVTKDINEQK